MGGLSQFDHNHRDLFLTYTHELIDTQTLKHTYTHTSQLQRVMANLRKPKVITISDRPLIERPTRPARGFLRK